MKQNELLKIIIGVGEYMFKSTGENITRNEFMNFVGKENIHLHDLILKVLKSLNKIDTNSGRHGGIKYIRAQKRKPEFSIADITKLKKATSIALRKHNEKRQNKQTELDLQNNFESWLLKNESNKNSLIGFRQDARKNGEHKNVDGYKIEIERYKYHVKFKPILTTYELKTDYPRRIKDMSQPRNYKKFSHFVWMVFKDTRPIKEIKEFLFSKELVELNDGIGIYITSNEKDFQIIKRAERQNPDEYQVDQSIENLLSTTDKEGLLGLRSNYLSDQIISLLN